MSDRTDGLQRVVRHLIARQPALLAMSVVLAVGLIALVSFAANSTSPAEEDLAEQRIQYDDDAPKTIVELQRFRTTGRVGVRRADGALGVATLIDLSPEANTWYLLTLAWSSRSLIISYHLENPDPKNGPLRLVSGDLRVLDITTANGSSCRLWNGGSSSAVDAAAASGLPYAPLCAGALYLRNPVAGHRTSLERVTDFLRDHVWGGDRFITFVKREFYRDEFLERSDSSEAATAQQSLPMPGPASAMVSQDASGRVMTPQHLGLDLEAADGQLHPGQWYAVRDLTGVSASVLAPEDIARSILTGHEASVNPLGTVESGALIYLVAFDLQSLDLHFALGTDHPRLDWSERPPPSSQDPRLPGPDGIDSAAPLVMNGMVSPVDSARTVASFAGGFKRAHGAFKFGPLAEHNHGSHYGFLQEGVVLSKLQPGLATVFATSDGIIGLKTWTRADDAQLEHLRYARQNGVPLIEYDPNQGIGVPGALVNLWGQGNWSGSADEDLRTLRAGLCLQDNPPHRFLIYAYFSAATPSGMARVFQAYHCRYAMHMDMNALEHTYLAVYVRRGHEMVVEHLVQGMEAVDRQTDSQELLPRFLGFPDDRDFFYLTRHEPGRR